jgi:kynurenine 3-monooxygenase
VEEYGDDWETIFSEYQISRKLMLILQSRNFMEMSSKTADDKSCKRRLKMVLRQTP